MTRRLTRRLAGPAATAAALLLAAPAVAASFSPPFRPMDPQAYAIAKRQAAARAALLSPPLAALAAPAATVGPRAKVEGGTLNQPGLSHDDNSAFNDGTPPDPTGAIGPAGYIEFVNSVVRLYDRDLTTVEDTQQLDDFVGDSGNAVFDPQIQYDPVAQRWFYLADDCAAADCSTHNFLAFGFSKARDPASMGSTDWCSYTVRVDNKGGTGLFDDYPKLGHDDTHLIFGTNVFDGAGDFVSARIWTVPKPAAGTIVTCPTAATLPAHYFSGTAASPVEDQASLATHRLKTSSGSLAFTPVPANTQDASANGYVVAAGDPPGSMIMAWHMTATPSLVADGNISVSSFDVPAPVPQPGTSDVLDSSDTRLTQAVAHADPDAGGAEAVWTQHTVDGPGGRSVDRWYELLPATKTKRQEGTISDLSNFVFNGAISPTMAGNEAVIEYNVGGASQLAQIKAQSRGSARPLGTAGGEITLGTSTHFDQDFSCPSVPSTPPNPSCRWGDYAAATPDPDLIAASSQHVVWGTNQLIGDPIAPPGDPTSPHWTTRNFALVADAGPIASFTVAPNPTFTKKTVSFDASASQDPSGGTMSFEWDFGDGTFVPGAAQVTHTFNSSGTFTVRVRVSDDQGNTPDVASQQLTVVSGAPTAAFSVAPTSVTRGQQVTFDGSASHDAEAPGGIATYAWDFDGNGTVDQTTTGPVVTHAYTGALGTFTPKLTVTDVDDGLSSQTASGSPVVVSNVPPTAQISFSPTAPSPGNQVTVSGAGSSDPDGTIVDYRWDLNGDGVFETDTGAIPQATTTFPTAGTFTVGLRVQDSDGAATSTTAKVPVARPASPATKLTLALSFAKKVKLGKLLKSGLAGRVGCREACVVKLTLTVPKRLARALKIKTTIGRLTLRLRSRASGRARIRLSKGARHALGRTRAFSLLLRASAGDAARHSSSAKRTVRVRR